MQTANEQLLNQAKEVLAVNTIDEKVIPALGLYPHQVMWDSCFIAIGLSHYQPELAKKQIQSFLNAQWQNGMIPHIIFNPARKYWWARRGWRSRISPLSRPNLATSGITQPPMFAQAAVRVGAKLDIQQRIDWYTSILPALINYHNWLFRERDSSGSGLLTLIHPWETGLDNTPPWLASLRHKHAPWWINMMVWLKIAKLADHMRFDAKYVDYNQRSSTVEALRLYHAQVRIRRQKYDTKRIMQKPPFAIEDLAYNCIFIRANTLLKEIAEAANQTLPKELLDRMEHSERSLENLWDKNSNCYYSRNQIRQNFLKEPSVASLLPLYSGAITKNRAEQLVAELKDKELFNAPYPIPSVPLTSSWFKPMRYWQGPTWININWLIINGLEQYGFAEEAERLKRKSTELVGKSGFFEYFNPLNGEPAGVNYFSWTAALIIDLLNS